MDVRTICTPKEGHWETHPPDDRLWLGSWNLEKLNFAVLYLSKDLQVTACNDLAGYLLDPGVPVGSPLPLRDCLAPEGEEYCLLAQAVHAGHELRDCVVRWEVDGLVRHVLIDSFLSSLSPEAVGGQYVLLKDLGNFGALEQQLQRKERLAVIGKVAAGVAHEIRNPLTTVSGFLQMMEKRYRQQGRQAELAYTQVMLAELLRMDDLVTDLLLLSRPQGLAKVTCVVAEVVNKLKPELEIASMRRQIVCEVEVDASLRVRMIPASLTVALRSLAQNALEAMEHGGSLRITATQMGGWVRVDVSDSGPGIPYYQMDKIFDAFFTTKEKGTGLGLPICQKIVDDNGGEIRVSSKGFGATFTILLPAIADGGVH